MNEFLADLYGTRENIGAPQDTSNDVEKLAEAQVLDQFLTNEGIDVDQLDGDTILKVAYDLFGEDSEIVKAAAEGSEDSEDEEEGEEGEEEEKDAQEKLAEADFLGRVMAHSFVDEQSSMDKQALSMAGLKATAGTVGSKLKDIATAKQFRAGLAELKAGKKAKGMGEKALTMGGRAKSPITGEGMKAEVRVGRQTVRFDGEKLVLGR